jgi:hypothetical protein
MARHIKVKLNSGRKETKLSHVGMASNGLRGRFLKLMTICSADSAAGKKAFELVADRKNVSLEGLTLTRMQILR